MYKIAVTAILSFLYLISIAQENLIIIVPEKAIGGSRIEVTIEYNQRVRIQLPKIKHFKYLKNEPLSSYKIINGKSSNSYGYLLSYTCDTTAGKYIFPPIKVIDGHDTLYTKIKNIEIIAKDTTAYKNIDKISMLPYAGDSSEIKTGTDIFATITSANYSVKKNDTIDIKFTLYNGLSNPLGIITMLSNENKNIFILADIDNTANNIATINGRNYQAGFYSLKIIPRKEGNFKFTQATLAVGINMPVSLSEEPTFKFHEQTVILIPLPEMKITVSK